MKHFDEPISGIVTKPKPVDELVDDDDDIDLDLDGMNIDDNIDTTVII